MAKGPTHFDALLGHDVRSDPWPQQGHSSYALALDALDEHRIDDAVALARMSVQEAQEAFDLYALWLDRLPALLSDRGVAESVLSPARHETVAVKRRLERGWIQYLELVDRFEAISRSRATPEAPELLEAARMAWLAAHDPATDQLAALFALAAQELGEPSVGPLWDDLLGHYYAGIAEKYDPSVHPWPRSVERLGLDIFEAVRGHLTGPQRDGRFDVREEAERWVLEFAPCGSGGRTYPGTDGADGAGFTTEAHDWAWRTEGVCLYCVHCCQLQQRAPIDRIGIPLRVIRPPVQATSGSPGRAVCTWSIYKDLSKIPAHAYTDVGATPPTRSGTWISPGE